MKAVVMAGGFGTRIQPLTNSRPKPMLPVVNRPMMENTMITLRDLGITDFIVLLYFKPEVIQDYFGDGSKFGANIEYIFEEKRMGTAGALSLLENKPTESFFVMNGDLLTNVNFEHLLEFHLSNHAMATMCVREYDFQVPYGVVNVENGKILH